MGIRFYCPNGHKLNVKSYLAGKRGICPDCGAKVLIPEPEPGSDDAEPNVPQMAAPSTTETAAADVQQTTVPAGALPLASTGQVPGAETEVVITTDEPGNVHVVDPIDENPEAVWYVRLASGNQYGPAAGDVFRTWLDEGRVTADCLVWREGWPEWQTASTAFPQLIRR
ncbi:MAG: DUF4339 domain-containing protein [Pirellulales bacterium]|nr:DUF4339 domain-containing protein [Pirellulales bacterium]